VSTRRGPRAAIVIDTFHVVEKATEALDEVRREHWNEARATGDADAAEAFEDARWSLLTNPRDLAHTLTAPQTVGGKVPPWAGKETVREIFKPGLSVATVERLIDRLISRLSCSRRKPFVTPGRTIRKHREGILAAGPVGLSKCPRGGAEQQGEVDRPPRLRVSCPAGRAGAISCLLVVRSH
jgi:transposase